jgi:NlpC/P60 family protein
MPEKSSDNRQYGMWTAFKVAVSGALLCFAAQTLPPISGQGMDGETPVLLSAVEGEAVVNFALQHERRTRPRPDCSHLVHTVYKQAGLNYPYADSRDLYNGEVDEFERIAKPQPGDLVAWRGHVGIVVSPQDKTFFSSVRAGIITEPWTTDYWKMRGKPRFLRYRVGPGTDRVLLARLVEANTTAEEADSDSVPVSQTAETAGDESVHPASPVQQRSLQSETADPDLSVIAEIRGRRKPRKQDVEEALRLNSQNQVRRLDAPELLDSSHPISVFDHLEVRKIRIKDHSGTVTLKVSETLTVDGTQALAGKIVERELNLYRKDDSWIVSDPHGRIYLPQQVAVSVFERQAQASLRRSPGSGRTRAMVKALDLLYDDQVTPSHTKPESTAEARRHGATARD